VPTPGVRILLAGGLLAAGLMTARAGGLAQQGLPQAPEVTVYKAPT